MRTEQSVAYSLSCDLLDCFRLQYLNAKGSFVDPHTVEAMERNGTKHTLTAERIVIAVGGRPRYLEVPGGLKTQVDYSSTRLVYSSSRRNGTGTRRGVGSSARTVLPW